MRKAGLGRSESEVLRFVSDRQPISVRDVADHFAETRGLMKTTVLNMMERLRDKGFLVRESVEGIYQYSATQPKSRMLRDLVRDFVDGMLGGSLEPFAAYLAENPQISEEDLARLKETIAQLRADTDDTKEKSQ